MTTSRKERPPGGNPAAASGAATPNNKQPHYTTGGAQTQPLFCKMYPVLGQRALLLERDRELRLWCLARAVDDQGRGQVRISDLAAAARRHGIKGFSRACISRLTRQGDGTFWNIFERDGERWISLVGLARVALALGVDRLAGRPVVVPFPQKLQEFRAWLTYAGFSDSEGEYSNPISRQTLTKITGKTDRTQRNYARALGKNLDSHTNAAQTGQTWRRGDDIPEGYFPDYVGGNLELLRVLPSSFRLNVAPAARGMCRKVNRWLRHALDTAARAKHERLFYHDTRAAIKRLQAQREGDALFLANGRRSRCGAHLWDRYSTVNGAVYSG